MNQKYFNPSYIGPRDDVFRLIAKDVRRVLDVGCSVGTLGLKIKRETGAEVIGIELDPKMAEVALTRLDQVINADVEKMNLKSLFSDASFDCIVFADLLEHLINPWEVLKLSTELLTDDGTVIASLPNIRHYSTFVSLLRGYWPYRERGIHDKTHLRFFTLSNIREMFHEAGLTITRVERKLRIIERPHRLNRYSSLLNLPYIRDYLTFQFLILAKKIRKRTI